MASSEESTGLWWRGEGSHQIQEHGAALVEPFKRYFLGLNVAYLILSLVLISCGGYAYSSLEGLRPLRIADSLLFTGVLILCCAIGGLSILKSSKHGPMLLYLSLLFLFIVCQIVIGGTAYERASSGPKGLPARWNDLRPEEREELEKRYSCCGWDAVQPSCPSSENVPCAAIITKDVQKKLRLVGGLGVIPGVLELLGLIYLLYQCYQHSDLVRWAGRRQLSSYYQIDESEHDVTGL